MIQMHLGIDDAKYAEAYRAFERMGNTKNIHKAMAGAVNRAATTLKAKAAKEVRKEYTASAASIKDGFKMLRRATAATPGATVAVSTSSIPMHDFKVSPNEPRQHNLPRSLRVTIRKSQGKNTKYFVARMPSGHVGVFERIRGTRMRKQSKEQIREMFSVSPATMTENPAILEPVLEATGAMLRSRFDHEVERLLGRK